MIRTVRERFRGFELASTDRTERPGHWREIRPARGTEKRDPGVAHRRVAVGAGGGENKIQYAVENIHKKAHACQRHAE